MTSDGGGNTGLGLLVLASLVVLLVVIIAVTVGRRSRQTRPLGQRPWWRGGEGAYYSFTIPWSDADHDDGSDDAAGSDG